MHIKDSAKVRLAIDGVILQTTAGNLRRGAISHCLATAWADFEMSHAHFGSTGRLARYTDNSVNRDHDIQIDIY